MSETDKLLHMFYKQLIHSIAKVEIPTLKYLSTDLVLQNLQNDLLPQEVLVIKNLETAVREIALNKSPLDAHFVKNINYIVLASLNRKAGKIREGSVTISKTSYIPGDVDEQGLSNFINDINRIEKPKERAATFLAKASKRQFFWDGNKRTTYLIANKILTDADGGLFLLPDNNMKKYVELMTKYYEDERKIKPLVSFIVDNIFATQEERIENNKKNVQER